MIQALVFFLSGFAGLVYEVVFARSLALSFGSTAAASTAVLATYMGGMALGAWLGGGLAARARSPLRAYAALEVGIAIWCALSPWLLRLVHQGFLALARGQGEAPGALALLRIAAGALFLLPPTVLMGATLPLLSRSLSRDGPGLGRAAGLLYSANTAGGALGALAAAYALLPFLGVRGTLALAVAANLLAALAALRLAGGERAALSPSAAVPEDTGGARSGLALLALVGAVSFALEVLYVHLLAIVAGNTTYAFALMLAAFLTGLALGAQAAGALLVVGRGRRSTSLLALACLGLAASVLAGIGLWEPIPDLFVSAAERGLATTFFEREVLRGLVSATLLVPPAFAIGAVWALAMHQVAASAPALGRAAALNTLGNIAGAFLGGFVLLPVLGSRRALLVLGASAAWLALLPAARLPRRAWAGTLLLALAVTLPALLGPGSFDPARLAAGTSVYFARHVPGAVIDSAESLDGGMTTVTRAQAPGGRAVKTLLTNGKFQGDDNPGGEMAAQLAFAICPLLHTSARQRALVIGLGTGATTRVIADAGFARIDVAELAPEIPLMARRHFASVNGGALDRPEVKLHVADGRNVLLLERGRYDLISIEVTSIWLAGAASLYNREFYLLARERLGERGVLQQWVQLHRLSEADLVSIVASLRAAFANVWLYFVRSQGVLVACQGDCRPGREALDALETSPRLEPVRALFGGSVKGFYAARLLTPEATDRFLADAAARGLDPQALVSTDDNLYLEHSTPRANVREYAPTLAANLEWLASYAPGSAEEGTALSPADVHP